MSTYAHPTQYNLIDDTTRVKDVFMLKSPTDAPRELTHLFDYQLTVLNSIRLADEQSEQQNESARTFSPPTAYLSFPLIQNTVEALEWVRTSDPDHAPNLVCVYLSPKYDVPDNAARNSAGKKRPHPSRNSTRIMVNAPKKTEHETDDDAAIPDATRMSDVNIAFYLTGLQKLNSVLFTIPACYMTMAGPYLCITSQSSNNEILSMSLAP